jgi:hypothetical protein
MLAEKMFPFCNLSIFLARLDSIKDPVSESIARTGPPQASVNTVISGGQLIRTGRPTVPIPRVT